MFMKISGFSDGYHRWQTPWGVLLTHWDMEPKLGVYFIYLVYKAEKFVCWNSLTPELLARIWKFFFCWIVRLLRKVKHRIVL